MVVLLLEVYVMELLLHHGADAAGVRSRATNTPKNMRQAMLKEVAKCIREGTFVERASELAKKYQDSGTKITALAETVSLGDDLRRGGYREDVQFVMLSWVNDRKPDLEAATLLEQTIAVRLHERQTSMVGVEGTLIANCLPGTLNLEAVLETVFNRYSDPLEIEHTISSLNRPGRRLLLTQKRNIYF